MTQSTPNSIVNYLRFHSKVKRLTSLGSGFATVGFAIKGLYIRAKKIAEDKVR